MYYIYRHYSKGGTLLYVGMSSKIIQRHKSHRSGRKTQSKWFDEVAVVKFEALEVDKSVALQVEREVIIKEKPLYNKYKKTKVKDEPKIQYSHILKKVKSNAYWKAINDRREKVINMKASGMTWAEIGNKLGISRQRAHQLGKS